MYSHKEHTDEKMKHPPARAGGRRPSLCILKPTKPRTDSDTSIVSDDIA